MGKSMFCLIFCFATLHHCWMVTSSVMSLKNNAYSGVLIAINPEIPENANLILAIKDVWTQASSALYTATNQRAYFGHITILVPKTWTYFTYNQASKETYDDADVLVAYPNPLYQDQPYTLQYGSCGQQASYIHLTPAYLMNASFVNDFGPKGKAMVHEWGHYRWGVFDETYTYGYNPFYFNSAGQIEATRCTTNLKGEFKVIDFSSGTSRDCNKNLENGLPEDGCMFVPYEEQSADLTTSIMSHQYIEQVEKFCHNDVSDSYNRHNKDAPNEQNRMCNLRSTWEVILESPDFANGANPTDNAVQDTTPIFNVVRPESARRYVLVLDTSGSMDGTRLSQMRQVVSIFISQFVPTGDRVGIVEFETKATTLIKLRTVQSKADRDDLLNVLPDSASGSTCIGCGLNEALDVLQANGESASGGNIIVFTDGEEKEYPFVKDVSNEVIQKGAIVHAIFFNTDASNDLEQLVEDTGGIWFFGSDVNIISILGAFKVLAAPKDGDVYSEIFQVHSSMFEVRDYSTYTGDVIIDTTVGNSTVFSFTWSQYDIAIAVVLEHPSGCTYSTNNAADSNSCPGHPLADVSEEFNIVTFPLPGTAAHGRWRYYVSSASAYTQLITATVTSQASNRQVEPIVVTSGLDKTNAGTGEAIVVYAQVSQGFSPVIGADVLAKIERPDGTIAQLNLYDAGAAPDVRRDDGVYSRYFTEYNNAGSYAVQVTVTNTDGQATRHTMPAGSRATLNVGTISANGKVSINPDAIKYEDSNAEPNNVGSFSRVVTSEGFEYTGMTVNNKNDFFPPNKVSDLTAQQSDVYNATSGIVLTFTAPGSDYDTGTASRYDVRYVINNLTQLVDAFETCQEVNSSFLMGGSLDQPNVAGSMEKITVLPHIDRYDQITLGFAVRAYDSRNNVADPSNVAPVIYFISPPGGAAQSVLARFALYLSVVIAYILVR